VHFPPESVSIRGVCLLTNSVLTSAIHTANPGMDWEYFSFSGHTRPELLAYPDGTVELIMTVGLITVFPVH